MRGMPTDSFSCSYLLFTPCIRKERRGQIRRENIDRRRITRKNSGIFEEQTLAHHWGAFCMPSQPSGDLGLTLSVSVLFSQGHHVVYHEPQ